MLWKDRTHVTAKYSAVKFLTKRWKDIDLISEVIRQLMQSIQNKATGTKYHI
jgi:acetyl-CoA carboxylase alpha subunit